MRVAEFHRSGHRGVCGALFAAGVLAVGLLLAPPPAKAQADGDGGGAAAGLPEVAEPEASGRLTAEEARRLLQQPLPEAPDARYVALQQQYRAAMRVNDRQRVIETTRQLAELGRGRPDGEAWIRQYLGAEFTWGSSGRALEAAEPFIADAALSLPTRATAALRQTYYAAQGNDRAVVARLWSRADRLARQAIEQLDEANATQLRLDHLQVRAETQRLAGDSAGAVETLRESIGIGRRYAEAVRTRVRPDDPLMNEARALLDGAFGMLVYALVQNGRPQEAIEVARGNVAQWRAGQLGEATAARWLYRLATGLVATQQYEAGLAAARESDRLLERIGAGTASHTRWLAQQEIVRALIGLKRWQEADVSYRGFLAAMPPDLLARTRASDNRLLALLAAKNGRMEEALDTAERLHRFRMRLFGHQHPQTQEAAGLRAIVRLLRGEVSAAMADYEVLFAATLDTPAGWLDLDARGVRGYVLGIAFDEFMAFVAERALKGERLDSAITDRAFQVADRLGMGVTQRAITDSTARVLAATPALRELLEAEQAQRQASAQAFSRLNGAQGDEDAMRREARTDAFKAKPEPERRAVLERLRTKREEIKKLQADAAAARTTLDEQRQRIARDFPGYAELVTPTLAAPGALRKLLGTGEALLVVQPQPQATLVWLLQAEGPTAFAASALTREALATRVAALREMLDLGAAPPAKRPALQAEALHALWRDLAGGVAPALQNVKSLVVATNGPLAALPFGALVTEPPAAGAPTAWLVRRMAVTQLPAPASLHALRRVAQPAAAARPMIGFGDPVFDLKASAPSQAAPATATAASASSGGGARRVRAAADAGRYDAETGFRYADIPPLPETRAELTAVAEALGANPATDLVLGERATRRGVLTTPLVDRRVVAFATHGLLPGELPGVSKPALAMSAESDPKESPLLELDDVLGLRLNAQWVLLSACNTAGGEQDGAAMSGLVRGFFFAGARSVLATHWAVETESAAALSATTFRQFREAQKSGEVTRAEALRRAQLALIEGQQGGGRWAHPYFWAPYALFGDPAR